MPKVTKSHRIKESPYSKISYAPLLLKPKRYETKTENKTIIPIEIWKQVVYNLKDRRDILNFALISKNTYQAAKKSLIVQSCSKINIREDLNLAEVSIFSGKIYFHLLLNHENSALKVMSE